MFRRVTNFRFRQKKGGDLYFIVQELRDFQNI
jgi:hypothetical protein